MPLNKSSGRREHEHQNGAMDDDDEADLSNNYPIQDPAIRREIRFKYRQLTENIKEQQHELTKPDSDGLQKKLEECNNLFKNVKMTREAALDSNVVAQLSQLGKQKAQALQTDLVVFQPAEFCDRLIRFLRGGQMPEAERSTARISKEGWVRLGEAVQPFLKRSPPAHFMYGSFINEEKEKVLKQKRGRNEDINDLDKERTSKPIEKPVIDKKESTTEAVSKIQTCLQEVFIKNRNVPVCYYEFITNPTSFDQSVENMFYTSFLIRDGSAKISLDEDKLPVIEPVTKQENVDPASLARHQIIMMLDKKQWRDIISTFDIKVPLIATRGRIYRGEDEFDLENRKKSRRGRSRDRGDTVVSDEDEDYMDSARRK